MKCITNIEIQIQKQIDIWIDRPRYIEISLLSKTVMLNIYALSKQKREKWMEHDVA